MALKAINNPGKGSVSFTSFIPLGISEKACVISGNEADMVIMDIMVKLLTSNKANFTCQLSEFIVRYIALDHFSFHKFR